MKSQNQDVCLGNQLKIAFITNFCSHYRVKTFEILSSYFSKVIFFFFSAGEEWYWQQKHGVKSGNFKFEYLRGFRIGKTRITPDLLWKLLSGDYDLFIKCINGKFALPITFLVAKIKRKPFILWTGIWMRLDTPLHRLGFPITNFIYHHSDAIVVYGVHVKNYLIREGIPDERIFITTHAVDNENYFQSVEQTKIDNLKRDLNILNFKKIILFLGRFEKIKGLPFLVEAFSLIEHKDVCLVLVGEGSERKLIENQVEKLGINDRVRFAGYVSNDEALPFYALADLFVLPSVSTSEGKETWGLVVNEAFNQGVPVIASDAVGAVAGGLIEDGVNGFIVPEQNSRALAEAIAKILDNPQLRDEMSMNARKKIKNWDNENMVLGFRKAIEYVIKKNE